MAVRLFVGNLSYSTTEADLRTYFGNVAPPSQIVLPVDRETGRPRGFAFVEYLDRGQAEQAIQKAGWRWLRATAWWGRRLRAAVAIIWRTPSLRSVSPGAAPQSELRP